MAALALETQLRHLSFDGEDGEDGDDRKSTVNGHLFRPHQTPSATLTLSIGRSYHDIALAQLHPAEPFESRPPKPDAQHVGISALPNSAPYVAHPGSSCWHAGIGRIVRSRP